MSANPNALKEMPSAANAINKSGSNIPEPKTLNNLSKNEQVMVNKLSPADIKDPDEQPQEKSVESANEFMKSSESEFGSVSSANKSSNVSHSSSSSESSASQNSAVNTINQAGENKESSKSEQQSEEPAEEPAEESELETTEKEEENSAAELVAAAAAQIANKTIKKPHTSVILDNKQTGKTLKATSKLLASGKQEQVMKKAMLMLNESGKLNVVTDEPMPSIVKLNTPVNKAQIKLRAFRQNFEKQLGEMRRKTPLQMQSLKAELSKIEFAEIGNKNIIAGLLELVDDHELKLLTIEKMLKQGDITLSF